MYTPKGCRLEMCVPRRPSQTKCAFPSSLVVVIVIVIVVVAVYTENQRPASPVIKPLTTELAVPMLSLLGKSSS